MMERGWEVDPLSLDDLEDGHLIYPLASGVQGGQPLSEVAGISHVILAGPPSVEAVELHVVEPLSVLSISSDTDSTSDYTVSLDGQSSGCPGTYMSMK